MPRYPSVSMARPSTLPPPGCSNANACPAACLRRAGPAVHNAPGGDLGPGDERPAATERPPRQLLGGDDHAQVVVLSAGREAAVLLGNRQAEPADLGQAADDVLRDVGVRAVDVLRDRPHLLGGETVERLA